MGVSPRGLVKTVERDLLVGRQAQGPQQTEVSVRGGSIVIGYSHAITMHGFEVTYSVKAMKEFTEILTAAIRTAEGKG